jgi:hypothetical protein
MVNTDANQVKIIVKMAAHQEWMEAKMYLARRNECLAKNDDGLQEVTEACLEKTGLIEVEAMDFEANREEEKKP